MLPKEYGSGSSTCHRRFQEWWILSKVFDEKYYGLGYYKYMMMISEVFNGDGNHLIVFLSKLL
jgi:hypothetical protein